MFEFGGKGLSCSSQGLFLPPEDHMRCLGFPENEHVWLYGRQMPDYHSSPKYLNSVWNSDFLGATNTLSMLATSECVQTIFLRQVGGKRWEMHYKSVYIPENVFIIFSA